MQQESVIDGFGFLVWFAGWLAIAQVLACSANSSNSLLNQGDRAGLAAPTASFRREIERMQWAHSKYRYVPRPAEGDESATAELRDLQEALRQTGKSEGECMDIVTRHAEQRKQLLGGDGAEGRGIEVTGGLPVEFADYFRGAVAWHRGDSASNQEDSRKWHAEACLRWEELLRRPVEERRFKSTWAAFMLGVAQRRTGGEIEKSVEYLREVRRFVDEGFEDSLGLAAASLGHEAAIHWGRGKIPEALKCYLEQMATGDPSAIESLRTVARSVLQEGHRDSLPVVALDPTVRLIVTAHVISRRNGWPADPEEEERVLRWLDLLEIQGIRDAESAEKLALAAYQAGRIQVAKRWLGRANDTTAAGWLRAKILLHDGQLDEAVGMLARVCREFALETAAGDVAQLGLASNLAVAGGRPGRGAVGLERALGELGVLRLARREFTEALDALLRSGFWLDAAYVAERVLSVDELQAYVDANWAVDPNEAALDRPQVLARNITPEVLRERIRHLLARRLARGNEEGKADGYYPERWRLALEELKRHMAMGRDVKEEARERAGGLFSAALLVRKHGLELFGTETAPDWHVYRGNSTGGVTAESRTAIAAGDWVRPSAEELARAVQHGPEPDRRFHYRYRAAELAKEAAGLLPDEDDETARILCLAGSWLKDRDPKAADLFYKLLVRRCGKTVIGAEADRLRWFPRIDAEGKLLPPAPKRQPALEPEGREPIEPGPLAGKRGSDLVVRHTQSKTHARGLGGRVETFSDHFPSVDEKAGKVSVHDQGDVILFIPAVAKHCGQAGEVGDGFKIGRGLFAAVTSIQVRTDARMACVAGELAHVIDVIDECLEFQVGGLRRGLAANPTWDEHPRVEHGTDDGVSLDEHLKLVIGELAVMRNERAGIGMAGPDGTGEVIERFPEAFVAQVSGVEDDAQAIHLVEQFATALSDAA